LPGSAGSFGYGRLVGHIDDIANRYVDEWAPLDPIGATYVGISGQDHRLNELTPEGYAAQADLDRRTLAQLDLVLLANERERVAKEAMQERLGLALDRYDAGAVTSEVSVIAGALHVRSVFDLMPMEGEEAAGRIAARMAAVPTALAQTQVTLLESAAHGHVSARHQMLAVAEQCDTWISADGDDFWPGLARRVAAAATLPDSPVAELDRSAAAAREATAEFAAFLRTQMGPIAPERQAVGREKYQLASRYFLGAKVDLDETYTWGFAELDRIEEQMRTVAKAIVPDGTVPAAIAALDADPARKIAGKEAFRDWMQELADRAISELQGTHFDIPEQVRRIECCIAPTSDGGVYYTGPTEDFSRPGRMWWAVPKGIEEFSTWQEVTTVYHEGVPGHHLQIGQTAVRAELLNRWQRLLCLCSGHGEGWAPYAERLMDNLGYLDDPGDKMGMLEAQAMRAARVIVDIGMHLELEIPKDNRLGGAERDGLGAFHPGERWNPQLGWELMRAHCSMRIKTCASSSIATSAGPGRRRPTRSASGSGCRRGPMRRRARAPRSTSRLFTGRLSTSAPSVWIRCGRR
jgi:uncharacterized protein (DUF885 family)